MLEFLNEQDDLEPKKEKEVASVSAPKEKEEEQPAPKTAEVEFISTKAGSKNLKKTTMIVVVLFVLGVVGLFIMIKKGGPRIGSAQILDPQQAQIDSIVAKLGGVRSEMSNKMDVIVKKFYDFANVKQVSLDQLSKNPFLQGGIILPVAGEKNKSVPAAKKVPEFRLFSIERASTDASKWFCMINDKLLNVGQTISGFTVAEIGADYVILQLDENKITLKLVD